MKKLYTLFAAALISLGAIAQDNTGVQYTENLVVTVDGTSTEVGPTTVMVVDNNNDTYNFILKNFLLIDGDNIMPVGNITVTDVPCTKENGLIHLAINKIINIEPGDLEGSTPEDWIGPLLGEVPLDFSADISGEHVYAHINIDMSSTIGQIIEVTLGTPIEAPVVGTQYTENLVVTVDGTSTEVGPTTVMVVDNDNDTYNFILKNFLLIDGDNIMPVGNITVTDVPCTKENGITHLAINKIINIEPGDLEGSTPEDWIGPLLGEVPLDFSADISGEHVYAHINIDMSSTIGQIIEVTLGSPLEVAPTLYTLTFVIDSISSTVQLEAGAAITAPQAEEREGYTFAWDTAIPEAMPDSNLTITGTYTVNIYAITYKVGDEIVKVDSVAYGAEIVLADKVQDMEWMLDGEGEIPATMPAHDLTIKANPETAVNAVLAATDKQTVYTLDGRKANAARTGLYIIDGKKVIVNK